MSQEFINKHLSIDQNYILKISQSRPLKTKSDFYAILKWWKTLSKSNTIGNLKGKPSSNKRLIHIVLDSNMYYLNADTNKDGVAEFLKNKENNWVVIRNENGIPNKVTNRLDESPIKGFYFYKLL